MNEDQDQNLGSVLTCSKCSHKLSQHDSFHDPRKCLIKTCACEDFSE